MRSIHTAPSSDPPRLARALPSAMIGEIDPQAVHDTERTGKK